MKAINLSRKKKRDARHKKVLKKFKTIDNGLYRLRIVKTNGHIYANIMDDENNKILFSASSLSMDLKNGNKTNAQLVGAEIAKKALAHKIKKINFDCGGNKYHGRIAVLADAARKTGLEF